MATEFGIKDGYRENPVAYFLDDLVETRGIVFQPDVYGFAEMLAFRSSEDVATREYRPAIIDVGCGYGDKLAKIHARHPDWRYTGIDYGENIAHCQETYPWGHWRKADFEEEDFSIGAMGGEFIICSDVIEHLANPKPLLRALDDSYATAIILSTPERDLQHGEKHNGPSPNIHHVREWNYTELHDFLTEQGFDIKWHGLTRSSDAGPYCQTQLVVM